MCPDRGCDVSLFLTVFVPCPAAVVHGIWNIIKLLQACRVTGMLLDNHLVEHKALDRKNVSTEEETEEKQNEKSIVNHFRCSDDFSAAGICFRIEYHLRGS